MIPDYVYLKLRTETAPDGQIQIVDKQVFFTEETVNRDMALSKDDYAGTTTLHYYKAKVIKTPLEKGTE